jgi:cyclopropane-fatty-acyl-phospholipid synthase
MDVTDYDRRGAPAYPTFPVPAASRQGAAGASTPLDHWALRRLQEAVASASLRFVLWDGYTVPPYAPASAAAIVVRNRAALFRWLWNPDLNFGEGYMFGDVEIRGDLLAVLEDAYRSQAAAPRPARRVWWPRANGLRMARANVHHHYDLGNAFYRLWLDRDMVYTCAYFPDPDSTLEQAQIAKMDRVCRKLRLQPGERVVEAGCGWGSLALFMAERYGVSVRAFNISTEQIEHARARARRQGMLDRVEFIEDDYRNMRGTHDVFVSVGMLEHVGLADFATLGRVIDRSLTDRGRGLLHFIGRDRPAPLNAWIRKRIFPGAYPPTLGEVSSRILEPYGLSVLDVENLRLHYAKTLEHWRERFEASAGDIEKMFDGTFVRAWRLYLTGSQASFSTGWTQLFQIVFSRGGSNAIPWTRDESRSRFAATTWSGVTS